MLRIILLICCAMGMSWSHAQVEPGEDAYLDEASSGSEGSAIIDTLDIRDMDINDCLKLLSAKSGLNIIAGKSINGRVTIFLQNVEVHDALTIILKANDLAYIESRGVIQIVTASEYEQAKGHKFGVKTQSFIATLQSVKASDALVLLSQIKSSAGKIIADDSSNSIIIEDSPERMKQLREYLKSIDLATQMKVHTLLYSSAEVAATKLQEIATPKIGSVKFDAATNKLFLKDTPAKLLEMDDLITQIDVSRETKVFQISYAKAEDLAKTVALMLTKDIGNTQFDSRSNTLVVTDIPPKVKEISAVIKALDKHDKEVLIEAKIVQVALNKGSQMGIDWEAAIPDTSHNVLDLKSAFPLPGVVNQAGIATVGTLSKDNYALVLKAIATMGKSRLLSNPRIAVVNNQEAKIMVGTTTPYVTDSITTPATGPSTTAETVNFIDTGVKLHVTPTIHDDGYVTIKIKPEVSDLPKSITTSVNNLIPVVNTSEVETTIRVKDGVTIIIGGLIKDEVKNTQNKIPFLGDLPVLGGAFRNDIRSVDKTEIVIFLTPHIISGDIHVDPDHYTYVTRERTLMGEEKWKAVNEALR